MNFLKTEFQNAIILTRVKEKSAGRSDQKMLNLDRIDISPLIYFYNK